MSLDLNNPIFVGDTLDKTYLVEEKHTAAHISSSDLKVLSIPQHDCYDGKLNKRVKSKE